MAASETGTWNITVKRGSPLVLRLGDATRAGYAPGGVAFVWTGSKAFLDVRGGDETRPLAAAGSQASSDAGTITFDTNGRLTATIPASVTAAIPKGEYRYDLRVEDSLGVPRYILQGYVTVEDRVTKGGGP